MDGKLPNLVPRNRGVRLGRDVVQHTEGSVGVHRREDGRTSSSSLGESWRGEEEGDEACTQTKNTAKVETRR